MSFMNALIIIQENSWQKTLLMKAKLTQAHEKRNSSKNTRTTKPTEKISISISVFPIYFYHKKRQSHGQYQQTKKDHRVLFTTPCQLLHIKKTPEISLFRALQLFFLFPPVAVVALASETARSGKAALMAGCGAPGARQHGRVTDARQHGGAGLEPGH